MAQQAQPGSYEDTTTPLSEMQPKEIVQLVDSWFDRVVKNRVHVERDALLNISFLLDNQYVDISRVGDSVKLIEKRPAKSRVRTIEQIIEPAVRSELARLLRSRPQGIVIPQGDDPEDFEAAAAADDAHRYVFQAHQIEEYIEQGAMWILAGGTAHLGVHWDPEKVDENGNQGDFVFRALSVFEFGVPSLRRPRIEDQRYVMVTKAYEVTEIEEKWGVKVTPDRNEKFGALDDRLSSIVSTGSSKGVNPNNTRGSGKQQNVPTAIVKEVWIKPGLLAPKGAFLVVAGGQILDIQVWPEWCNNRYPFYKLEYMSVPGAYWAKPMMNALIPIQRRHNRAASIIVETLGTIAQIALAAPRNTKVRGIMGGKGILFESPLGSTQGVTNIGPPQIGDFPFAELENTRIAVRDISHQHEVTKGTTPPNVRSGTAINALKELDDSAATIPIRSIERAVQGLGRSILAIIREMWDEPRFIYVLGVNGDIERNSFLSGKDIGGQFVVQPGSAWPYSKAERQNMIFRNLEYQLITPEEALQYQDLGLPRSLNRQRNLDLRHARRENQKYQAMAAVNPATGAVDPDFIMQQAQALLPADWHNHAVHLQEHNNVRKTPGYELWPSWKKALLDAHITGHMAAIQAQMDQAAGVGAPPSREEQMAMERERRQMEQEAANGEAS